MFEIIGITSITSKYGPEKTPYLDTFRAVNLLSKISLDPIIFFQFSLQRIVSFGIFANCKEQFLPLFFQRHLFIYI